MKITVQKKDDEMLTINIISKPPSQKLVRNIFRDVFGEGLIKW